MAVYYKFKSAKDYDSIPIDGHFITVATLKEKIYESKQLGRGTDYDLVVTHAQTGEEYLDEGMLIAKNTTVLIRRVPGRPRMPIVTAPVTDQDEQRVENRPENVEPTTNNFQAPDPSVSNYFDGSEYDEFGNDLYEIPEVTPVTSSNPVQDAPPPSKADEDDKIKALVDTPALDWQRQNFDGFGPGRGYGRGMGGRMGGRGFGRGGLAKTPPEGYICHRCKTPGHFIQHCPTNGDPNFDIKRVKPPTGIPKSMLQPTPDGVYALPSGAVGLWKPNEAAFEKEIEGMPSTRNVGDLPPELHCPLCKEVMKDAVLTSKCCFQSFCDKCIRDHIMSKSACVCGATNVLADDLLPNKTLRDTINRILESNNSSADIGGNALQLQDMESARCPQPKVPSPSLSVASRGEQAPPPPEKSERVLSTVVQDQTANIQQQVLEKGQIMKVPDVSEATHESKSVKEHVSQGSARPADEEVQQKQVLGEAAKKKKKKKAHLPMGEMQWRGPQDFATENYMMPPGPSPYNPYWNPMQPGMEAYLGPYGGGGPMPYNMGYGLGPFDVPFGNVLPQDPFGVPGYMMPPIIPPQRDLADLSMGFNAGLPPGPPIMSREEFEARKAELRRKREMERRVGREQPRDQEFGRVASNNGDISSMKLKSVRTLVVHVPFISLLLLLMAGTASSVYVGSLSGEYPFRWKISNYRKSFSAHDTEKNKCLVKSLGILVFVFLSCVEVIIILGVYYISWEERTFLNFFTLRICFKTIDFVYWFYVRRDRKGWVENVAISRRSSSPGCDLSFCCDVKLVWGFGIAAWQEPLWMGFFHKRLLGFSGLMGLFVLFYVYGNHKHRMSQFEEMCWIMDKVCTYRKEQRVQWRMRSMDRRLTIWLYTLSFFYKFFYYL